MSDVTETSTLYSVESNGKVKALYWDKEAVLAQIKMQHPRCDVFSMKVDVVHHYTHYTGSERWRRRILDVDANIVYEDLDDCRKRTGIDKVRLLAALNKGLSDLRLVYI